MASDRRRLFALQLPQGRVEVFESTYRTYEVAGAVQQVGFDSLDELMRRLGAAPAEAPKIEEAAPVPPAEEAKLPWE